MAEDDKKKKESIAALEAQAVHRAKLSADAAFSPPTSVWKSSDPKVLLKTVDGVDLSKYQAKESTYVGRSVPISAGGNLKVPIQVTTPGSVVEYAVEVEKLDLEFTITAEREEGITIVKEKSRVDLQQSPVTQKFLVGTVPCMLNFQFDNSYSWMREKVVSYKITITPPNKDSLKEGRKRRAQACLDRVQEDLDTATERLEKAAISKTKLDEKVAALTKELEETREAAAVATKEEAWLAERKSVRGQQKKLLQQRLAKGWPDE